MSAAATAGRVGGFALALAATFGVALAVGDAVGPLDAEPAAAGHGTDDHAPGTDASAAALPAALPGGLLSAQDGYRLRLDRTTTRPGPDVPVAFTVEGPDGRPVTAYDVAHGKRLHLVAVRRDQTGFQHVHPRLDEQGTWRARLDLEPGSWRLFADFTATGAEPRTLGVDLAVAGAFEPARHPEESRVSEVDGYTVRLDGELEPGEESDVGLTVTRDGAPVRDLQPYLGAFGHLVALRDGDLAYLHVHPHASEEAGPEVRFTAAVPSAGSYHLYLDFKHAGEVHTASFVVPARTEDDHGH
jgi:hypothetical protein